MKDMKRILLYTLSLLLIASCKDGENSFGRVDQIDGNIPVPQPAEVVAVKPTSGGAVIKIRIPDDRNIKGVIATYYRNGKEINARISRYVDSLKIEGYADTEEHIVQVSSFNANAVKSTPVEIRFRPLMPAIRIVKPEILASAGGVKIRITGNTMKSDLAVCLLRDPNMANADKPIDRMNWIEVTTLFTASNNIMLTRRGIEPVKAIFGAYLRDRWGNISDTVKTILTPLEEIKIPKKNFKYFDPGDDNCFSMSAESSSYPVAGLWDDSGNSSSPHFLAIGKCPIPCWLTIDLGQTVELSRIATLPRQLYNVWRDAHPRDFEFWGSMNPSGKPGDGEHGFDDTWFCLGKFTQFKPSGYNEDGTVGNLTTEDYEYFNNGNDFELDNEKFPHAFDQLRYLRIVFKSTFATFLIPDANSAAGIQFGEITPWGQIVK